MESLALDDYIQANYKTQTLVEMAQKLGVSRATVCRHAKQLGCTKYKVKSKPSKRIKQVVRIKVVGNLTRHKLLG